MKREQVLLLATVAFLALLGWRLLATAPKAQRAQPRRLALELEELGELDPVATLAAGESGRDPFREPREVEPLPPLDLPLPPLGPMAALLPPPVPDAGPEYWSRHLLVQPPVPPGGIDELVHVEEADGASAQGDPAVEVSGELDYEQSYDSVRIDALTVRYGRLLDADRYDRKPGDPIRFQEVDPRTGVDRFAEVTLTGEQYESFQFARTLRNEIELRVRATPASAGAIRERVELIDWLLDRGLRESVAFDHALRLAREGVELAPDDLLTWMTLGKVWETTFQFDHAVALYARLTGQDVPTAAPDLGVDVPAGRFPRRAAPRVRLATILLRFGLLREAEEQLRSAAALGDGDPDAPSQLGRLLVDAGRPQEGQSFLERAASLYPSRSEPEALRNGLALGAAHLRQGQWQQAASAYHDTVRAAGDHPLSVDARAGEIAATYLSGDFARAASAASAAVAELGAHPSLLYLRGICGAAAGAPAGEVILDLRAAATAGPLEAALPMAAQAFWLQVMGEEDLANEALAEALQLSPEQPYARYLRGRWARQKLDLETARTDLRAVLEIAPGCAAALAELGWLLHEEGRYQAAEIAMRRSEKEATGWAEGSLRRGFNLLALEEVDTARDALSRAASGGMEDSAVRNALAVAAYQEGDLQTAIGEFAVLQDQLRAEPEDPQFLYAQLWQGRIADHDRLRRWFDPFDGRLVRPQWDTQSGARLGVEPRVLDGQLVVRGQHREQGETRVFRKVPAVDFRSFQATLAVGAGHRGEAGVMLSLENRRTRTWSFRVYRDSQGKLRWSQEQGSREKLGEIPVFVAPEQSVTLRFALDREQNPPILRVTADGRPVFEEAVPALRSPTRELFLSLSASTINALPVDLAVDEVELIYSQS